VVGACIYVLSSNNPAQSNGMIGTFFLTILNSFLGLLVGFLPTGGLPAEVSSSITSVWGFVNAFSYVIALDTAIQVLVVVIGFELILLLWAFVNWIIRKIPGMQ